MNLDHARVLGRGDLGPASPPGEDREKAYAAGFDVHLVKPGDPDHLQDLLANGAARSHSSVPENVRS